MTKLTTDQKFSELQRLAKETKKNIFTMLKLTSEIFTDNEYVETHGGRAKLLDRLETQEFGHFGRTPRLQQMLAAYNKSPDRKIWEEYHYNINIMIQLAQPNHKKQTRDTHSWKHEALQLRERVQELELQLSQSTSKNEEHLKTIQELHAKVNEQSELIGELRGRLNVRKKKEKV